MFDFLSRGIRPAVGDVLRHGGAEEKRVLKDHADAAPKLLELQFAHIHAVHEHATVSDVVKARDQADQSRFAGGGWPDDSDGLAGFAFEAHLGKRGFAVAVIETDLLEIDAPEVIKLAFAAPDVLRFVDYFENALGAGAGVLDDAGELTDHPDPVADGHQIKHHLRQIAEGQAAPNDLSAADPKHERQTQAEDEVIKLRAIVAGHRKARSCHRAVANCQLFVEQPLLKIGRLHWTRAVTWACKFSSFLYYLHHLFQRFRAHLACPRKGMVEDIY